MPGATVTAKGDLISYSDGPIKSVVLTVNVDPIGRQLSIPKQLTVSEGSDFPASWLPDNRTVIFQSDRTGQFEIFKQADSTGTAVQLTHGPGNQYWPRLTSDGSWILYQVLPHVLPKGLTVVTYEDDAALY